jgi:membrane fusion protein (multidrug efflux system)
LMIPQRSSFELQDKRFVYTLSDDNRVITRAITSRPSNDGQFLIVQDGLKQGDRVVINGSNLKDSTKIIPRAVNSDSLFALVQKN